MTQPTLSELITARSIMRQKLAHAMTDGNVNDRVVAENAIKSFDAQIVKAEAKLEPTYGISQDGIGSFIITHKSGFPRYAVCPCCDKPILSLARAEILAKNLTLLDARCDSIDNLPMEGQ